MFLSEVSKNEDASFNAELSIVFWCWFTGSTTGKTTPTM